MPPSGVPPSARYHSINPIFFNILMLFALKRSTTT
jgi:hypothetical protein